MFGRLGWAEILVIVVLLVILFGHNKIPNMMRNLANGLNVFKKEIKKENAKDASRDADVKTAAARAPKKASAKKSGVATARKSGVKSKRVAKK